MPESIFQTTNEIFCSLTKNRFTVTFAWVTHDDTKNMALTAFTISSNNRPSSTKVNLSLIAGSRLYSAKWKWICFAQSSYEPENTVVADMRTIFSQQVLMNSLGTELLLNLTFDNLSKRLTLTGWTRSFVGLLGIWLLWLRSDGRLHSPMYHWHMRG